MSSHDAFAEAVAAYALDALDEKERGPFEAHLATCDPCQRELADLRLVTARLGLAIDPVAPSKALRARTIARATGQPVAADTRAPRAPVAVTLSQPSGRSGTRSVQWLAVAASVMLIVGLGWYAAVLRSEVTRLQGMASEAYARADELRDELVALRRDSARLSNTVNVLGAPDTFTVDLRGAQGAPSSTGRAYVSAGRGLVFAANRLPPLSPGRVYQLWVIPPGATTPLSVGVFSVDASGASTPFAVVLPAGADRVKTVAVTDEPGPAGSPQPSAPILLAGSAAD